MNNNTTTVTCGQCRGQGTTVWNGNKTTCLGCQGSGNVRVAAPATLCGQCRGHGTVISQGKREQCGGCGDSGYFKG